MTAFASEMPGPERAGISAERRLRALGPPYLGLVVVEFLLGISLNLFVALPSGTPATILAESPLLDVHVLVGILLLGISANAVRFSLRAGRRGLVAVTAIGFLSGLAAFSSGLEFAFGSGSAAASFAMSVGFVGLLIAAGALLGARAQAGVGPATAGAEAAR